MRADRSTSTRATAEPDVPDLTDFTAYDDGEFHVVCDRTNPKAWIRSDVTTDCSP